MNTLERRSSTEEDAILILNTERGYVRAEVLSLTLDEISFVTEEILNYDTYEISLEVMTIPYECNICITNRDFNFEQSHYMYTASFKGLTTMDLDLINRSLHLSYC